VEKAMKQFLIVTAAVFTGAVLSVVLGALLMNACAPMFHILYY
jgi:hypothetical protein